MSEICSQPSENCNFLLLHWVACTVAENINVVISRFLDFGLVTWLAWYSLWNYVAGRLTVTSTPGGETSLASVVLLSYWACRWRLRWKPAVIFQHQKLIKRFSYCTVLANLQTFKSHVFGVKLTHLRSISRFRADGRNLTHSRALQSFFAIASVIYDFSLFFTTLEISLLLQTKVTKKLLSPYAFPGL